MSDENKNPFGEATVVHSRAPAPTDSERTVVHAAGPDVKPAAPPKLPKATPPPEPAVYSAPAVVIPVNLGPEPIGGAVILRQADSKKSKSDRREMRRALQRKTRWAIGGALAFSVVAIIAFVFVWRGPSISFAPAQMPHADLASESTGVTTAEPKALGGITDYVATTEVLSRFDRASAKAREKALDFSKSNSGF